MLWIHDAGLASCLSSFEKDQSCGKREPAFALVRAATAPHRAAFLLALSLHKFKAKLKKKIFRGGGGGAAAAHLVLSQCLLGQVLLFMLHLDLHRLHSVRHQPCKCTSNENHMPESKCGHRLAEGRGAALCSGCPEGGTLNTMMKPKHMAGSCQ